MWRFVGLVLMLSVLVSCGKNDGLGPSGYGPYINQAPMPPSGPYPAAGGGYAASYPGSYPGGYPGSYPGTYPGTGGYPGGGGYGSGYFTPQMPSGMPPQYYPFLPISSYFQQSPSLQNYWGQYWNGWLQYAGNQGYDPYDFPTFWTQYCPQQWNSGSYAGLYGYYNSNVYFWVTPQTQFPASANPSYFWQNYTGMPYASIDISYCDSCN